MTNLTQNSCHILHAAPALHCQMQAYNGTSCTVDIYTAGHDRLSLT
jgi:hypothetical protein